MFGDIEGPPTDANRSIRDPRSITMVSSSPRRPSAASTSHASSVKPSLAASSSSALKRESDGARHSDSLLGPEPVFDAARTDSRQFARMPSSSGLTPATGSVVSGKAAAAATSKLQPDAPAAPLPQPVAASAVRKAMKKAEPAAENGTSRFSLNKRAMSSQLEQIGATLKALTDAPPPPAAAAAAAGAGPTAFESAMLQAILMQAAAQQQLVQSNSQHLQLLHKQQQQAEAAQKQAQDEYAKTMSALTGIMTAQTRSLQRIEQHVEIEDEDTAEHLVDTFGPGSPEDPFEVDSLGSDVVV